MSFTLDHNDIDQTNDDTDSLYIVISDEPLHQSRPVQLLTKDKLTPPYTLSIPYSPQQVDFKTAFAVHLFDVCKTEGGENKQLDFVIRENEFPKGVAKGATNTTLNIIYQAIKIFVKDRKKKFKYYTYVAIVSHRIKIIFTFFFGFIYVCPVGTIALPLILCSLPQDLEKVNYCSEKSGWE
ncbi:unnamed protein product [Rhizophagus irregularis]|nr:unnamed protein product [Rhizophagus irregularis]